jgi:cytosine/adenosine deaminase-related metal-dependent hydrolase
MIKRILLLGLVVLVALGAFLWWSLVPPAPLALPPQGLVLADVTVVQPGEGRLPARRIAVDGGRVAEIGPADGSDEFGGRFVLPGLIDMHVHFPPKTVLRQSELFAFLYLYHGVTTVRDAADADGTATAPARDGVREGRFPGPRIFACGPLLDGPEPIWANSVVLREPSEAEAAVAKVAADGFDCVKVYNSLSGEVLAAIRESAQRHGLPVIGHVPMTVPCEEARLDDVQHLIGVLAPRDPPLAFTEALVGWRSFDEERARFVTGMSLAYDIAHTPTLVVMDRLGAMRDYDAVRRSPDAQLLPRYYRDVVWSPTEGLPFLRDRTDEDYRLFDEALKGGQALVARMHRAGVRIHAGTDTQVPFLVPGAALHRELRFLADSGLGPDGALAAATTVPGASLGLPGLGRVEAGAPADLLIFREDPTRDLEALATLEAVVAEGRLYRRADLEVQLDRYRRHHEGRVFDAVSVVMVRRVLARIFAEEGQ